LTSYFIQGTRYSYTEWLIRNRIWSVELCGHGGQKHESHFN